MQNASATVSMHCELAAENNDGHMDMDIEQSEKERRNKKKSISFSTDFHSTYVRKVNV